VKKKEPGRSLGAEGRIKGAREIKSRGGKETGEVRASGKEKGVPAQPEHLVEPARVLSKVRGNSCAREKQQDNFSSAKGEPEDGSVYVIIKKKNSVEAWRKLKGAMKKEAQAGRKREGI